MGLILGLALRRNTFPRACGARAARDETAIAECAELFAQTLDDRSSKGIDRSTIALSAAFVLFMS